jgi:hypothetical protein
LKFILKYISFEYIPMTNLEKALSIIVPLIGVVLGFLLKSDYDFFSPQLAGEIFILTLDYILLL